MSYLKKKKKMLVHPEPVNGTLFGNWIFAEGIN